MTSLWFESALLPQGWARSVRLSASDGRICEVSADVAPAAADERHGIGVPGLPNLHSHAFQRGLAGLTERRAAGSDSFWSWRELMYRFVERIDPDEFEALSTLAFAEMLEAGFTHVGEFHYLHHDRGGVAFADPGELATRIAAAASHTGIGLTLLPVFYAHSGFGGARARRPPMPLRERSGGLRAHRGGEPQGRGPTAGRQYRGGAAQPAGGDRRGARRGATARPRRRCTHTHRRTDPRSRGVPRLVRTAAGRVAAR